MPELNAKATASRYNTEPKITAQTATQILRPGMSVWPKITAAKPTTMVPTPDVTSAKLLVCANSAPAKPTNPFDSAKQK